MRAAMETACPLQLDLAPRAAAVVRAAATANGTGERCGVLLGARRARRVEVHEARLVANLDPRPGRFVVEPGELVAAERDALARGLELVGFVHTHPRGARAPSRSDRAGAWDGHVVLVATEEGWSAHWPAAQGFAPIGAFTPHGTSLDTSEENA